MHDGPPGRTPQCVLDARPLDRRLVPAGAAFLSALVIPASLAYATLVAWSSSYRVVVRPEAIGLIVLGAFISAALVYRCRRIRLWAAPLVGLLMVLLLAVAASAWSAERPRAALSCVSAGSCGCRILVQGNVCPDGGAHFFHELADGAPLWFDAGHGPGSARSTRSPASVFSHGPGEAWTERYRHAGGDIEIRYAPAPSTCPKLAQGEACEYFDVRAEVLVPGAYGTERYAGMGTCGC